MSPKTFYGLKFSLITKWNADSIRKNIPGFPADVEKTGMWNSRFMCINYPWGYTNHDWDVKWTMDQLCIALNNFKGHYSQMYMLPT